jgi:hypothetical protein
MRPRNSVVAEWGRLRLMGLRLMGLPLMGLPLMGLLRLMRLLGLV